MYHNTLPFSEAYIEIIKLLITGVCKANNLILCYIDITKVVLFIQHERLAYLHQKQEQKKVGKI